MISGPMRTSAPTALYPTPSFVGDGVPTVPFAESIERRTLNSMASKKPSGLGRGLGALLGDDVMKQEGSLYPVFTLTRFDSMLEAALLICVIGLARGHSWVHEVLSGGPVVQAEPQARAVERRAQLSHWRAAGQAHRGPWGASLSISPSSEAAPLPTT